MVRPEDFPLTAKFPLSRKHFCILLTRLSGQSSKVISDLGEVIRVHLLYESQNKEVWAISSIPKDIDDRYGSLKIEIHDLRREEIYTEVQRVYIEELEKAYYALWPTYWASKRLCIMEIYEYPADQITVDFTDNRVKYNDYQPDPQSNIYKFIDLILSKGEAKLVAPFGNQPVTETTGKTSNLEGLPPIDDVELAAEEIQDAGTEPAETSEKPLEPWEKILDSSWDRMALYFWWQGYEYDEIAKQLDKDIVGKTVMNKISQLRNMYSEKIVPTDKQLKKSGIKFRPPGY